jgi:spore maturation protein CgeB
MRIIWYAEDDMMNPRHRTRKVEAAMPFYDLWVTTKSFNALPQEVPSFGVRNILFVNNSYDGTLHQPTRVSEQDKINFGADVSFVGTYEKDRAGSLAYLAGHGVSVRVWGNGWTNMKSKFPGLVIEDRSAYDEEYVKVISASKINLCFLRKENRDFQTCRSIEIPACRGFMLHERNDEMTTLVEEDQEAAYFGSDEELLEKCKIWQTRDDEREIIAAKGYERVTSGPFRHTERLQEILEAAQRTTSIDEEA